MAGDEKKYELTLREIEDMARMGGWEVPIILTCVEDVSVLVPLQAFDCVACWVLRFFEIRSCPWLSQLVACVFAPVRIQDVVFVSMPFAVTVEE